MDENDREQFDQQIEELKERHGEEISTLNETIGGQDERIKELENAIAEICDIARKA